MTDWSLIGGDPIPVQADVIRAVAANWDDAAADLSEQSQLDQSRYRAVPSVWTGPAAQEWATRGVTLTQQQVRPLALRLTALGEVMRSFAASVALMRDNADSLLVSARHLEAELRDNPMGGVLFDPGPAFTPAQQQQHEQATMVRARLGQVVAGAAALRRDYRAAEVRHAQRLAAVTTPAITVAPVSTPRTTVPAPRPTTPVPIPIADNPPARPTAAQVTAAQVKAMTPAQRAAYFEGLSPSAARTLALRDPSAFGNLDGVPLTVRAVANRQALEKAIAEARAAGDTSRLARLISLRVSISDQHGHPIATLVMFDPDHSRYGVLWGDPRAGHLTVLPASPAHQDDTTNRIADAQQRYRRAPATAVILWQDDDPRELAAFTADGLPPNPIRSVAIVADTARLRRS